MINNEIYAMGQGRGHYLPVGPFGVYVPSDGGAWRSSIPGVDVQPNPTVPAQTVPAGPVEEIVSQVQALPGLTPDQRGAFRRWGLPSGRAFSVPGSGARGPSPWADIAAAQLPIDVDLGPIGPAMPGGIMAPAQASLFGRPAFWLGSLALGGLLLFLAKTNNGGSGRPRRR